MPATDIETFSGSFPASGGHIDAIPNYSRFADLPPKAQTASSGPSFPEEEKTKQMPGAEHRPGN